jgi:hypothetical protein
LAISRNWFPGLLVLGLGRAGHDLVAPFLDGGHQALVLRFCDLPDENVEIGFSHYGSLLARHAIPHGAGIIGASCWKDGRHCVAAARSFQAPILAIGRCGPSAQPDNNRLTVYWYESSTNRKASRMRNLTVYQRFAMIIAALTIVLFAVSALQILVLRDATLDERRTTVRDLVEAATKVLAHYEGEAKAGRIEPDKARQMAFASISAMRWGEYSDYIGVYGTGSSDAGVTYVHANPKYINVNRWDFTDKSGKLLIQDIVRTARAGGGFVEYLAPRSAGGAELRKVSYVGAFGAGDKALALQAGAYVDDIDAVVFRRMIWAGIAGLAGLGIAASRPSGLAAAWWSRSTVPARRWTNWSKAILRSTFRLSTRPTRSAGLREACRSSRIIWSKRRGCAPSRKR